MSNLRFLNPDTIAKPGGYTHVVEVTGPGRIVYIAGQLGLDRSGKMAGDFRAQTTQVFENLKSALAAVGATFADVVKINSYVTDMSQVATFREVRDQYVDVSAPPASTLVAISRLARDGALVEIEAIAMLPK